MKTFEQTGQSFEVFENTVQQAINFSESFETRETSYTAQIIFRDQKIKYLYSFDRNKFEVLGKIAILKSHLKHLPHTVLNRNKISSRDIKYFYFSDNIQNIESYEGTVESFENVSEVDLSAAYFYAAKKLNIISDELFNKIIYVTRINPETNVVETVERSKPDRLKILGSMAVQVEHNIYKNGRNTGTDFYFADGKKGEPESGKLRNLWFVICKNVDDIFQKIIKIINPSDFLFYFVDGIYIRNHEPTLKKIENIFESYEYPYKKILINKFEVMNKNKRLIIQIEKSNGKQKRFIVPHREVKYYYIN